MLQSDELHVIKWLSQYGPLPKLQITRMLQIPEQALEKVLKSLQRQRKITEVGGGYYFALDKMCQPNQRMILAVWVLTRFIDKIDPMAHYPATYPSQLFFLKENTGYEILVLYEGEEHLTKLIQPDEDMKYIIVVPNIATISKLRLPNAPCLFATIDFDGEDEPKVNFYTQEDIADE